MWKRLVLTSSILAIVLSLLAWYGAVPIKQDPGSASRKKRVSTTENPTGFIKRTYRDQRGGNYTYYIFVPLARTEGERLPVMLYLNGYLENGTDGLKPLYNAIAIAAWEQMHQFPFIVIWAQCEYDDPWPKNGPSVKRALGMLRETLNDYDGDPERVYLSGISSGGAGSWSVAANNLELFSAVIPVSAADRTTIDILPVIKSGIPVWSYFVAEDEYCNTFVPGSHRRMLQEHSDAILTEVKCGNPQLLHVHNSWDFAYHDPGLYRWLAAQNLNERKAAKPKFQLLEPGLGQAKIQATQQRDAENPELESTSRPAPQRPQILGTDVDELVIEFLPGKGVSRFVIGLFPTQTGNTNNGIALEFSIDDLSMGGVYSWPGRRCLVTADSWAETAIRSGGWNNLRISWAQGVLTADVNGLSFIQSFDIKELGDLATLGFVAYGTTDSSVELRNARVCRQSITDRVTTNVGQAVDADRLSQRPEFPSVPIDLRSVIERWTEKQKTCDVEIQWVESKHSPYSTEQLHSKTSSSSLGSKDANRLVVCQDGVQFASTWRDSAIEYWRRAGIPYATKLELFHRAFEKRFARRTQPRIVPLSWQGKANSTVWSESVTSQDGKIRQAIEIKPEDLLAGRIGDLDDVILRSLLKCLRPMSAFGLNCTLESLKVISNSAVIDAIPCAVIEQTIIANDRTLKSRLWVDPARDFLILQMDIGGEFGVFERVNLRYSENADGNWRPESIVAVVKPNPRRQSTDVMVPGVEWVTYSTSAKIVECKQLDLESSRSEAVNHSIDTRIFDKINSRWLRQVAEDQRTEMNADEIRAATFGPK